MWTSYLLSAESLLIRGTLAEMLDVRVWSGVHQTFMAGVAPANQVGRGPVRLVHFQDLRVSDRTVDMRTRYDQAIANMRIHGRHTFLWLRALSCSAPVKTNVHPSHVPDEGHWS